MRLSSNGVQVRPGDGAGETIKIDNAAYVLTLDDDRRIVSNGTIMVEDGRISRIGKSDELAPLEADRTIDATDMVVTPGFINNHIHVSYAHAVRGIFPDDLDPKVYIKSVFDLQAAMSPEEERLTSLLAITELLKYGTTTFLDPGSTKHLDECMDIYDKTGCRIVVGTHVVDRPNPIGLPVLSTDEALDQTYRTVSAYNGASDGRVSAWPMPFDAAYCSVPLLHGAADIAQQAGTGLTLHQANRPEHIEYYRETYGCLPILWLDELGLLGSNTLLAHVIRLEDEEIDALAASDTKVVMCPTSALKTGSGMTEFARLPELVEAGVCVSLGTDSANNANLIETLRSVYLAAVVYKDARETTSVVAAELALEMATRHGAEALGLGDTIGSIEPGKRADLVLFDTLRPEWRCLHNPVNNLVYSADGRSVHTVLVDGRIVVDEGEITFLDETELIREAQAMGDALLKRCPQAYATAWPIS